MEPTEVKLIHRPLAQRIMVGLLALLAVLVVGQMVFGGEDRCHGTSSECGYDDYGY